MKEGNKEFVKSYFFNGKVYELDSEELITYNEAGQWISNENEFKKTGEKFRSTYTYTKANQMVEFKKYCNEELLEHTINTYENDLPKQSEIRRKFEGQWYKSIMEYVHEFR